MRTVQLVTLSVATLSALLQALKVKGMVRHSQRHPMELRVRTPSDYRVQAIIGDDFYPEDGPFLLPKEIPEGAREEISALISWVCDRPGGQP